MAKELPYFEFEPAEYLAGNISFCSLEAQGLFTLICCYYWQRSCSLTKEQFLRRINNPKVLDELISENVIKLDSNGFLIIDFLNDKFKKATKKSSINSKNGAKGGRPKKPKETEKKPNALNSVKPNESESKGIREDNIIEDNIIKEKKIEILTSDAWIESICIQKKLDKDRVNLYLNTFLDDLELKDELHKELNEIKSHFINWLNIQTKKDSNSKQVTVNGKKGWSINNY